MRCKACNKKLLFIYELMHFIMLLQLVVLDIQYNMMHNIK